MRVSQSWRVPFGSLYNKDYTIVGPILGSPYLGKLPWNPIMKSQVEKNMRMTWKLGYKGASKEFRFRA